MPSDIETIVERLELIPHPEGGFYKETYRDKRNILLPEEEFTGGMRSASTAIYYLLGGNDFSTWHKIKSDELWHYCAGSPLTLFVIDEKGMLSQLKVGNGIKDEDATFQQVVKKGAWFAAKPNDPDSYSLVSCTVAPGFDFKDFTLADTNDLLATYPEHADIISSLSRSY